MYKIFFIIKMLKDFVQTFGKDNYNSFLSSDIVSALFEYYYLGIKKIDYTRIKPIEKQLDKGFNIKGLPFVDNYIPKDNYKRYNNYTLINPISKKYFSDIGFNSFLSFIKPYLFKDNLIDYYNRFEFISIGKELNKTFKNKKVSKIYLSDKFLNRLRKEYLVFKGDLTLNDNIKVSFIRYDEFIKNIPIKSNYSIHQDIKYTFGTNRDYSKKNKYLLTSFIILVEKLDYDTKHNFIYLNSICKRDLIKTIKINRVKWEKTSKNKLLKQIRKNKYRYLDYQDKRDYLLKELKTLKKELKRVDKKYTFYKKELDLLKLKKNSTKEQDKLKNKLDILFNQLNDLKLDMEDINTYLIELDKKEDKFQSNLLDEKVNYSLKLKSYL